MIRTIQISENGPLVTGELVPHPWWSSRMFGEPGRVAVILDGLTYTGTLIPQHRNSTGKD